MESLVTNTGGKPTTNSLLVAHKFDKQHKNILRDIRDILDTDKFSTGSNLSSLYFSKSDYTDSKGEQRDCYIITRKGFTLLAMGFTGDKALDFKIEFIDAFDKMEEELSTQIQKPVNTLDFLQITLDAMKQQDARLGSIENEVRQIKAQTKTRPEYYTIVGYASLHNIEVGLKLASSLGRKASVICKTRGFEMEDLPDPRFGKVKTYPLTVLEEVFNLNVA